ncbi:hypothetical protein Nizo2494_1500 [Lactiplantibacillus plantarum]|uniref:Uncharacterized protein n=2 Tax=Lactiplantibacillus plantarum TaxID=1590 RepID=A0AAW3RGW3_LACPN|nr:hypothetical protein AWV72_01483 [Lactiplantibacillus plantarum]KPN43788.1 hypothetical protein WJL_0861 [Lactiplantibacillus plantarum WJL]KZD90966.1 hypothetical protein FBR5_2870 [Lactiplantibacillus plantarum]KZT83330.1 hypothetical protein Nizo1840_1609 [Lactiplantibacillus plantarum]KZU14944.1 hypothetical protein Nizo2264_0659 [Lactiplantibacillus plantarum]
MKSINMIMVLNTVYCQSGLINMILLTGYFCILGLAIYQDNW